MSEALYMLGRSSTLFLRKEERKEIVVCYGCMHSVYTKLNPVSTSISWQFAVDPQSTKLVNVVVEIISINLF
jgi:hypothetical protein